jgi:hypothetical protein
MRLRRAEGAGGNEKRREESRREKKVNKEIAKDKGHEFNKHSRVNT